MYSFEFNRLYSSCNLFISHYWRTLLSLESDSNLACGVDDFGEERLPLVENLMAERVLYCGIVAFDEVAFAVLHSK